VEQRTEGGVAIRFEVPLEGGFKLERP
jgi:hypothetical protein